MHPSGKGCAEQLKNHMEGGMVSVVKACAKSHLYTPQDLILVMDVPVHEPMPVVHAAESFRQTQARTSDRAAADAAQYAGICTSGAAVYAQP
jgi:hypothetical protein